MFVPTAGALLWTVCTHPATVQSTRNSSSSISIYGLPEYCKSTANHSKSPQISRKYSYGLKMPGKSLKQIFSFLRLV